MWHVLEHSLIDSLKVLPILFLVYVFIEIIEDKSFGIFKKNKKLNGKIAPIIGGGIGIIPQCGFSVIATDLFAKKKIAMGTLLAVFLATSDEAIPILLSNKKFIIPLLMLIVIKFVYAILVGYVVNIIYEKVLKKKNVKNSTKLMKSGFVFVGEIKIDSSQIDITKYSTPIIVGEDSLNEVSVSDVGCCGHAIEKDPSNFKKFIFHPLIHSLKIFAFILIVNVLFGILIHYVGEANIANFMQSTRFFQPFVVALIGLIPNCASSVIITDLFLLNGISFGSLVAGLCANAGIALAVLFKQNANKKENLFILALLYVLSSLIGVVISLF